MVRRLSLQTHARDTLIDITREVAQAVKESGVTEGMCTVFIPHTTAGITINENADPDVQRDMIYALDQAVPHENGYHHFEGNSAAHVKASMMGFSQQIIIHKGQLLLGTWQGIYFCEFDGPRTRSFLVKILDD